MQFLFLTGARFTHHRVNPYANWHVVSYFAALLRPLHLSSGQGGHRFNVTLPATSPPNYSQPRQAISQPEAEAVEQLATNMVTEDQHPPAGEH